MHCCSFRGQQLGTSLGPKQEKSLQPALPQPYTVHPENKGI